MIEVRRANFIDSINYFDFYKINELLLEISRKNLSGSLQIRTSDGLFWKINLRLGRLTWVTGGNNFQERWQRYLSLYCHNTIESEFNKFFSNHSLKEECNLLLKLLEKRYITRQKLGVLMTSVAQEVLFDIIQYICLFKKKIDYQFFPNDPNSKLSSLLPLLEIEKNIIEASITWENWKNADLAGYLPNLFPVIRQLEILKKETSNSSFSSIISLIDGRLSLRNLAIKSNCSLVDLTKYLVSMVNSGALFFSEVPTQSFVKFSSLSKKRTATEESREPPLIICVDDSPLVGQAMEKIIIKHGYRFRSIQQPEKLMINLFQQQPDFIFLDLLMPIVNGYELCAQLRKLPNTQKIPIVIMTDQDSLIERMKAKLAGSTDSISKPLEEELVIAMLDKHLKKKDFVDQNRFKSLILTKRDCSVSRC
ncbi:MAG: hypothetical protein Tsb0014_20640 [Pleurocapsa sp.]